MAKVSPFLHVCDTRQTLHLQSYMSLCSKAGKENEHQRCGLGCKGQLLELGLISLFRTWWRILSPRVLFIQVRVVCSRKWDSVDMLGYPILTMKWQCSVPCFSYPSSFGQNCGAITLRKHQMFRVWVSNDYVEGLPLRWSGWWCGQEISLDCRVSMI